MERIRVISVNTSSEKETIKIPVDKIELNPLGIQGDAHAGAWNRQVSLLGSESIEKMEVSAGRKLSPGEFAENITATGYPLYKMHALDRLVCGTIILEVTQIGKKCHGERCTIFKQTGDCVMPKEGIFCRVIRGGTLQAGDVLDYLPKVIQVRILTLSDRASRGEYEDKSGPLIKQLVENFFIESGKAVHIDLKIIPDDPEELQSSVRKYIEDGVDFIFTSGGTGIGPRDITPDVIRPMLEKEIPGIMEMIRMKYGLQFPNALISRSIAGITGKTLIYVLPGSPKGAKEYTEEILKTLDHSLLMVHSIDKHG
jgi:molybdenum cofactor synthesis domain-containing protein